jgi:hypothetical protein
VGYAGSRGRHLWRSSDVNVPAPTTLDDGTVFYPGRSDASEPAFSAIELKASDGDSWYKALIVDLRSVDRRAAGAVVLHVVEVRRHDAERDVLLGLDDGTTSAMPEFIPTTTRACRTSTPRTTG